jgi:hypothetical protein
MVYLEFTLVVYGTQSGVLNLGARTRSWGNPVPITRIFVLITVSKFTERQIRPFIAFPVEAATRYVGSDE